MGKLRIMNILLNLLKYKLCPTKPIRNADFGSKFKAINETREIFSLAFKIEKIKTKRKAFAKCIF